MSIMTNSSSDGSYAVAYDTPTRMSEIHSVKPLLEQKELSERSPLHTAALSMRDLKPGTRIRWTHINHRPDSREAVVASYPYRQKAVSPVTGTEQVCWMVSVTTRAGHEDWFLAEMGVVPHMDDSGRARWSCQAYTVIV